MLPGRRSNFWFGRSAMPLLNDGEGRKWCCRTGLNCGPPPYQGGALPLSYGSGKMRAGMVARRERGGNCHKRPHRRKAKGQLAQLNLRRIMPP
jgi:hypothetical protein